MIFDSYKVIGPLILAESIARCAIRDNHINESFDVIYKYMIDSFQETENLEIEDGEGLVAIFPKHKDMILWFPVNEGRAVWINMIPDNHTKLMAYESRYPEIPPQLKFNDKSDVKYFRIPGEITTDLYKSLHNIIYITYAK